jgi:hypothetical protein
VKVIVKLGAFAGKPLICIHEINEENKESEKAIISFGLKKAKAILEAIPEIRKFVEKSKLD